MGGGGGGGLIAFIVSKNASSKKPRTTAAAAALSVGGARDGSLGAKGVDAEVVSAPAALTHFVFITP